MPFVVCKVPMEHVQDTAGIEAAMKQWSFGADDIVAVVAKTEGNGGVNDISRILVDRVLRDFFVQKGSRTRAQALQVPIALSGGTDGVISPHYNIFAKVAEDAASAASKDELRMTVGFAVSERILPEEIGRLPMVEKVAAGVRKAMSGSGHYRPQGRALRADQDPAAHRRAHRRREAARQDRVQDRDDGVDGGIERHGGARHRRGRRRVPAAARGADRARPRRSTRRSPRARRASSRTRRRSSWWATAKASAGTSASGTRS